MVKTLSEIRRNNKAVGQHFFDRGNPPVRGKYGNYLVTTSLGGDGWLVYKYDESNSHINLVDNPYGEYSWQPFKSKADAINYAKKLAKKG